MGLFEWFLEMNVLPRGDDMECDFDEWARLYREDRAAFERRRKEEIEKAIAQIPEERRLGIMQLQWKIDGERRRHGNAMGGLIVLQRMMLDEVFQQGGLLETLSELLAVVYDGTRHEEEEVSGNIVPLFPRKK